MKGRRVLIDADDASGRPRSKAPLNPPWVLVGGLGAALVLVGGLDLALLFYPVRFGNVEWEFASISAGLNGLPVLAMGLVLVVAAALVHGNRFLIRGGAVALAVLGVAILGLLVVYALTVPIALQSTSDPVALLTIKKSIAKTVVQGIVYPTMFVTIAVFAWRDKRHRSDHIQVEEAKT